MHDSLRLRNFHSQFGITAHQPRAQVHALPAVSVLVIDWT